jgi:hypothetical protein
VKRRIAVVAFALGALLLAGGPAPAVDRAAVEKAIERGVKHLKKEQLRNGTWSHAQIGATALAGLTLLECGVPPDDPAVRRAAAAVRSVCGEVTYNYSLTLAILFLDRLGEPIDTALIQSMTVRLLGGQNAEGAWGYNSPRPSPEEVRRLNGLLKQNRELTTGRKPPRPAEDGGGNAGALPREIRAQLDQLRLSPDQFSDNSNTQFAILALWVARRHGMPVERALAAAERRFRGTQNPDGAWDYHLAPPGFRDDPGKRRGYGPYPSMTCAGLLGLALGYGANEPVLRTDPKGGGAAPAAKDPGQDPAIRNGLRALAAVVGMKIGTRGARTTPSAVGNLYYFLWSLERVAVIYDLETIGEKDWYNWGAEILLANQAGSGGWVNGRCAEGNADTCFALLFLTRVNLAKDLTRTLKGRVRDPGKVELRGGDLADGEGPIKVRKPDAEPPPGRQPDEGPKPGPGPKAGPDAEAERIAAAAVEATGAKQDHLLEALRDKKGNAYTDALAQVIGKLDGPAKKKARDALAERLSRMNSATLGEKLQEEDKEVRRAAALACAMREDKAHCARLIELLYDSDPAVSRAAHAALKSLSGQDLGPPADATRAEMTRAVAAWRAWWKENGKK